MIPETDEQFARAANILATAFLDKFARTGMTADQVANISGAAIGTILANMLSPFGAAERLRDIADRMEQEVLRSALDS